MGGNWAPRLGEPVELSLDPDGGSLSVRVVARPVAPARETAVQKFMYTPKLWASALAGLAVLLLMSTAVASGSIKPAPPPAPTPVPGQPTPTPDTLPRIQLPGFVLEAPARPAPVAAAPPARGPDEAQTASTRQPPDGDAQPAQEPPPAQACNNLFGIGCGPPQPPPPAPRPPPRSTSRSAAPTPRPPAPPPPSADAPEAAEAPPSEAPPSEVSGPGLVIPVASPGPGGDTRDRVLGLRPPGPPPGSNLDDALRAASIATQNFKSGLTNKATHAGE